MLENVLVLFRWPRAVSLHGVVLSSKLKALDVTDLFPKACQRQVQEYAQDAAGRSPQHQGDNECSANSQADNKRSNGQRGRRGSRADGRLLPKHKLPSVLG